MKILLYIILVQSFLSCRNSYTHAVSEAKKTTATLVQPIPDYQNTEINYDKSDTLVNKSEPFLINGIKCYWNIELIIDEGETNDEDEQFGGGSFELIDYKSNKILINHWDALFLNAYNNIIKRHFDFKENFIDVNFDGSKDFVIANRSSSGSAGTLYEVYLFDKLKKSFEFSDELSNYNFEVNTKDRTASTSSSSGGYSNYSEEFHFNKKGKIKSTEIRNSKLILVDNEQSIESIYKTVVNGEIVKIKIDTTKIE